MSRRNRRNKKKQNGAVGQINGSENGTSDRLENGKFGPGNRAAVGHGRPPKLVPQDYTDALQSALSPQDLQTIVQRAVKDASKESGTADEVRAKTAAQRFILRLLQPTGRTIVNVCGVEPEPAPKRKPPKLDSKGEIVIDESNRYANLESVWEDLVNAGVLDRDYPLGD